jgi:hypothetical protein
MYLIEKFEINELDVLRFVIFFSEEPPSTTTTFFLAYLHETPRFT